MTTTIEQFRKQCAKPPTEDEIYQAAQEAGLWPNTVHAWLPAFHRYHAIMSKRIAALPLPVMPEQAEPVAKYEIKWKKIRSQCLDPDELISLMQEEIEAHRKNSSALLARVAELEAEVKRLNENVKFWERKA